jgi:hypothetical protein
VKICRFILLVGVIGCSGPSEQFTVVWDNDRAVAVRVSRSVLPGSAVTDSMKVHRLDEPDPVLGEIAEEPDGLLFTPFVPFTGGITYEARYSARRLGTFEVPLDTTLSDPELLAVYPSADTLPENLLKMYLAFSEPMVEGKSLTHVYVIRNERDTVRDTFLDLQPELWNNDGSVLTLWLDPGRVKRDLIPNKTLGKPIEQASRYTLVVEPGWRSKQGAHTQAPFRKTFHVGDRDESVPDPGRWKVLAPASSSRDSLIVRFDEPLDFKLLTDAIHVLDGARRLVEADVIVGEDEKSLCFLPLTAWEKGTYAIMVEPRLEDLAGNNLARLFDRDLLAESNDEAGDQAREVLFIIQ